MRFSYNKLWSLLSSRGLNREDLRKISGISTTSVAKLGKGENVMTNVLLKICSSLHCDISEIVECVENK